MTGPLGLHQATHNYCIIQLMCFRRLQSRPAYVTLARLAMTSPARARPAAPVRPACAGVGRRSCHTGTCRIAAGRCSASGALEGGRARRGSGCAAAGVRARAGVRRRTAGRRAGRRWCCDAGTTRRSLKRGSSAWRVSEQATRPICYPAACSQIQVYC